MEGLSTDEVEERIPESWPSRPTERTDEQGKIFQHPTNKGEQIRVMRGDPTAEDPLHQGPRAVISRHSKRTSVPLKGNPVLGK